MKNAFIDKFENNKSSGFLSRGRGVLSNYILLLVIIISLAFFGYEHLEAKLNSEDKPKSEAFVYEVVMNLEVDGKPVQLKRRSGCEAQTYSKAGGGKFSEVSATGYSMSTQLPTGEYVFAGSPSPCRFFKKNEDENGNAKYEIPELMEDYLPKIHIADKAPVPDVVEIYDMPRAFEAPKARVKYINTEVTPMPIGTELEKGKEDPFEFFFGKGDGPFYFSMGLRYGEMIPELEELLKEHVLDAKEPVTLYDKQWFLDFFHGKKELGNLGVMKKKILPKMEDAENYQWVSFVFDEDTDFHDDTLFMKPSFGHEAVKVRYRLPYDALEHRMASLFSKKNITFELPSGSKHKYKAGNVKHHLNPMPVYDPKDNAIYFTGKSYSGTRNLTGSLKKYNYKVR
jgi:hypothetical protein